MPTFPVIRSMRRTVIYNLGSIALGSFVIAVIQFVRLVLNYLDKKTRKIQQESKVGFWKGKGPGRGAGSSKTCDAFRLRGSPGMFKVLGWIDDQKECMADSGIAKGFSVLDTRGLLSCGCEKAGTRGSADWARP
jgi:hypothetical protein